MSASDVRSPIQQSGFLALLARVFWTLLGNFVLAISLITILQRDNPMFHAADIVYWFTAIALVLVRLLDIKYLNGLTKTGAPATIKHWQRYAVILLAVVTVLWAAAHLYVYVAAKTAV